MFYLRKFRLFEAAGLTASIDSSWEIVVVAMSGKEDSKIKNKNHT
jgi:hypothetical protein